MSSAEMVAMIGGIAALVIATGGGFFFIGRLSARVDHVENQAVAESARSHACRIERVRQEEKLFAKAEVVEIAVASLAASPRR